MGNTPAACHVCLATTTRQFRSHPHLLFNSQIVGALLGRLLPNSLPPIYTLLCCDHRLPLVLDLLLDTLGFDCHGINKDVPSTVPSPSKPSASAAADVSARRTCPRCTRMSSLKFDKHSLCVTCRDVKCYVEVRCSECRSWSKDFMLGYVKHQRSLISKGKEEVTTSSPSVPVTAVTTAPVVSLPSLPVVSDDQIRSYVHSVLATILSQSGSIGTNLLSTAPSAVPNLALMSTGAAGGLSSDTPFEVPISESPGVMLPTNQEDLPPPPLLMCVCVCQI